MFYVYFVYDFMITNK